MPCEQTETELDTEIDGNSTENDFYFSYLTIDPNDDVFDISDAPEQLTIENIEFKEDVSTEFYETVPLPTLQQLASFVIAIESWHRIMRSENANRITYSFPAIDFVFKECKDVEDFVRHLPLPSSIQELVRNCVDPVAEEIIEWIRYIQCIIPNNLKISDLMCCVWSSEGKMDQRKTALNLLSNPEMDIFVKFKIMSEYCLEDEVKKLSLDSIPERFRRRITFDKSPLQYYWFCFMNKNFEKFPTRNGQSIEAFLFSSIALRTRSAVEYFWNRSNINEQISAVLSILGGRPYFPNIQRLLFSKMNQFQKYHVLTAIPFHIICNFYHEKLYNLAFLTMVRFGNVLTFEDFSDLIILLLDDSRGYGHDQHEALFYLAKIWNCSSVDYKNRALQSMAEDVIHLHCLFIWRRNGFPRLMDTNFLVAFLSSGSVDFRRNIILNYGTELVFCCDPLGIHELIQSCISDTEDLARFEKSLLNSDDIKRQCATMLEERSGDRLQLADFLRHYVSNSKDKIKFICEIIVSPEIDFGIGNPVKRWNNAVEFLNNFFDTASPDQIMKYKKSIIWSFVDIHAQCRYDYKDLHQFIQTISQILEIGLLERYKKVALKRFQRQCRWLEFDKIKIHQFLLWCLNYDYKEMRRFVKSLEIDRIFWLAWEDIKRDEFFEVDRSRQMVSEKLTPFDKMLLWYFEKSDRVKKFKSEKVFCFRQRRPTMFVKHSNELQGIFTRNVLPWFFEGDKEEIYKFKEWYKNDDIVKLIGID